MDLHHISREKMDILIRRFAEASQQGDFSVADVLLAAAEYLGRIIVNTTETPVSGIQMAEVMESHIKRCLHAGFTARGFNMGSEMML